MSPLRVAVVNVGSSSVKLALLEVEGDECRTLRRFESGLETEDGMAGVLAAGFESFPAPPEAVGYRVVHGGRRFRGPVVVDATVMAELEALVPLAPLHNGPAVRAMAVVSARHPRLPRVAVFDTGFHAARPAASATYALPRALAEEHGFERYGFHGLAHASLVEALARVEGSWPEEVSAVTLQLGAGCSACAVRDGRSVETSMGFTPLEGLVMTTRCGSIDPAVVLTLMRAGHDADWIEDQLVRRSGLLALAGSSDMRAVESAAAAGDADAELALALFCRRIVLVAGAYLTLLGGEGALVFGGGIGSRSAEVRARVAAGLAAWNVELDEAANRANVRGLVSRPEGRCVYVLDTDEETQIARATAACLATGAAP